MIACGCDLYLIAVETSKACCRNNMHREPHPIVRELNLR
jgi:hypothetical protein